MFPFITPTMIYSACGVLLSALGAVCGFVIKKAGEFLRTQWNMAMEKLTTIETTTRNQAENHLQTIQTEAVKQTALLETMTKEQAETNSYLKAVIDLGIGRRAS